MANIALCTGGVSAFPQIKNLDSKAEFNADFITDKVVWKKIFQEKVKLKTKANFKFFYNFKIYLAYRTCIYF
jgi:hypothetical protein